ncbi:hypothetical protein [Streptomyces sp. 6-11-2]|uniref:hypothetical protein n=1 Tax=Streptomyces sp. 6-11-2 TaxID=2585753 RepID=UPI00209BE4DE|nr:hypothetical protein [Streptomyces sp. 6-11-2]
MLLVNHDHIHRRVVDLDLLQQIGDRGRHAIGRPQAASLPSRAAVEETGSSWAIRRTTVPREGARRPRARRWLVISR